VKIDLSFLAKLKPDLTRVTEFFRYGAGSKVGDLIDGIKKRIPEDLQERLPGRRSMFIIGGGFAALLIAGGAMIFLMSGGSKDKEETQVAEQAAPAKAEPAKAGPAQAGPAKTDLATAVPDQGGPAPSSGGGESGPPAKNKPPSISMPMPPRLTGSAALLTPTPPPSDGSSPPAAKPEAKTEAKPDGKAEAKVETKPGAKPEEAKPLAAIPPLKPDEMEQQPGTTPASSTASSSSQSAAPALPPKIERTNALARAPGEPAMPKAGGEAVPAANFVNLTAPAKPPTPLIEPQKAERFFRKMGNASLPIIAPDGTTVAQAYARPFPKEENRPRVAIIVTDLGLSKEATEAAIAKLPPEVTLAFSPYADRLPDWIKKARAAGHEVLIGLPLEPENFPTRDPGPFGLLSFLAAEENVKRLDAVLGRGVGYVGILAAMGGKFLGDAEALKTVLKALKDRGLLFVDNGLATKSATGTVGAEMGLPFAVADVWLDDRAFRTAIDARLFKAEELAKANGKSLAIASAKPVSFERIMAWHATLEGKGVVVAPVSAVVRQGGS
jgi:polysaccharide deacetylase 2 family uncharacterized protein YibQ